MSSDSSIQWTDASWNPTTGCTMVSPGCANCYAEKMSKRQQAMARADNGAGRNPGKKAQYLNVINDRGRWSGQVNCDETALAIPLSWKKPRRIFVNSMSDLFWGTPADLELARKSGAADPKPVPFGFIDHVFAVMALCPQHTFQILTKRPDRMADYLTGPTLPGRIYRVISDWLDGGKAGFLGSGWDAAHNVTGWRTDGEPSEPEWNLPLPNAWLGTSVENQKCADERVEHLRGCPAAVRFLSQEPQLEPITHKNLNGIHWVIVGGESGPKARPFDVAWARSIIQQCRSAGVACFVKQLGALARMTFTDWNENFADKTDKKGFILDRPGAKSGIWRGVDRKGGDVAEWAEDLRVREMPGGR